MIIEIGSATLEMGVSLISTTPNTRSAVLMEHTGNDFKAALGWR